MGCAYALARRTSSLLRRLCGAMQAKELQDSTDDDPGDDFDAADDVPAVRSPAALHVYALALLPGAGAARVGPRSPMPALQVCLQDAAQLAAAGAGGSGVKL